MDIEVTRAVSNGKNTQVDRSIIISVDIPATLDEFANVHGEQACLNALTGLLVQAATAECSRVMQGGVRGARRMEDAEILKHMADFKLGIDYERRERSLVAIGNISEPAVRDAALTALGATQEDLDLVRIRVRPDVEVDLLPGIDPEPRKRSKKAPAPEKW